MPTDPGPSSADRDPLADLARQLQLSPVEGTFSHGYRAANWPARNNMGLEGTLFSAEILSLTDPDSFSSIRDVPIESLARSWDVPAMALLPRAQYLFHACNVRLARTHGRPLAELGMNDEQADLVLRLADFELAFESARREVRPDAPSRLSCVFLAEDNAAGRAYAQGMATMYGFVMTVRVPLALRIARVDAHWIGDSADLPTRERCEGYWSGDPTPDAEPLWEWLVDGVIRCADNDQFALLRAYNEQAGDVVPATKLLPGQ